MTLLGSKFLRGSEYIYGFSDHNRAWYARPGSLEPEIVEQVVFGVYHKDGGTIGEMLMSWYRQGKSDVPRLEAFCDSWAVLSSMPELIAWLATKDTQGDGRPNHLTCAEFCEKLLSLGFTDRTLRKAARQ